MSVPFYRLSSVGDGLMAMKKEHHQLKQLCREDFVRLIQETKQEMERVSRVNLEMNRNQSVSYWSYENIKTTTSFDYWNSSY